MERNTILAFVLCFLVLLGFQYYQAKHAPPPPPETADGPPAAQPASPESAAGERPAPGMRAGPDKAGTASTTADEAARGVTPPADPGLSPAASTPAASTPAAEEPAPAPRTFTLENEKLRLHLSNRGAVMTRAVLKGFYDYRPRTAELAQKPPLDLLDAFEGTRGALALEVVDGPDFRKTTWRAERTKNGIRFRRRLKDLEIEKTIELGSSYDLRIELLVRNLRTRDRAISLQLYGAEAIKPEEPTSKAMITAEWGERSGDGFEIDSERAGSLPGVEKDPEIKGGTVFGGTSSKYFAFILVPDEDMKRPRLVLRQVTGKLVGAPRSVEGKNAQASYRVEKLRVGAGQTWGGGFTAYIGPRSEDTLRAFHALGLDHLVDRTSRVPLAESLSVAFIWLLRKLGGALGSYGVAIILLTLLVRGLLHPLSVKSQRSTYKMQELGPKVKEIQARFEGKKSREQMQKMQGEIGALYKKHGVSPLMGCLPMVFQLPVFIGLYNALAYAIEIRQQSFLWISDLSKPDRTVAIPFSVPWPLESYLNVLPLLMAITMFIQQKMAPKPADPQQQGQQKMMRYIAVFFPLLFYTVPSGLVLYFFISSVVGMGETRWVRHLLDKEKAEKAAQGAAG